MNMDISTCGYQAILWIYPWIFLRHLIWTVTSLILNISYFRLPYNSAQQRERKFAQMSNIIAKRLFISAIHNIWQKSANFLKSNLFPNVSNYQKITHPRQDCHFVTNVIATPNPTTRFTAIIEVNLLSRHLQLRKGGSYRCKAWVTRIPLLTATSTCGLGNRRWNSPRQCYLHCLRTLKCCTKRKKMRIKQYATELSSRNKSASILVPRITT